VRLSPLRSTPSAKLSSPKITLPCLTSATLSSLGSFDRLNRQLGLTKIDNQYLRLPSPFSFKIWIKALNLERMIFYTV
jgi:ATP-dependent DNA helicase DinG